MATEATRERILDAAEELFSENGFDATSVRAITAKAGVHLAAMNYHFGSKDALIQAVFQRRVEPMNRERIRPLDEAEAAAGARGPELESILEVLARELIPCPANWAFPTRVDRVEGVRPMVEIVGNGVAIAHSWSAS